MTKYRKGSIVKGIITGLESYGIFVSLDHYYTGLIHISQIADGFVKNINDYVKVGETIYVKIIEVDPRENHVKLSIKNIDYHIDNHDKGEVIIKETGKGFNLLGEKLNTWIEEKIAELT